ncbi:MAG TPA: primosomal protein N', partial [Marinobacter sp.]|nr:primosomal protein N' [Marinobacter sp.]
MKLQPGQRVLVPFGPQKLTGLVTELNVTPPAGIRLKPIASALEDWPALPPETLRLLHWAADYYQHPLGECLFTALPPALRRGRPAEEKQQTWWQITDRPADLIPANAHRQQALYQWLHEQPRGATTRDIIGAGFSRAQLNSLHQRGLVQHSQSAVPQAATATDQNACQRRPELSPAQQEATSGLPLPGDGFRACLLYGITGSGKTELYLHYLKEHLREDQQALVLVPEINLTPQTVARFRHYFGDRIAVWHSALNDSERLLTWLRVRRGEPVILIGTRSAVLLPFTSLGTLIVDEEHDSSYKQGEGFRYSGRDLAVYRAHLNNCPVILGSATPSLESYNNALTGKYDLVRLEQRAGKSRPPEIRLLDIRSRPLEGGLARPTLQAIEQTVAQGRQVLVFVNRRGFAPVMMCFDCGHMVDCPRCDTRLTYHRR